MTGPEKKPRTRFETVTGNVIAGIILFMAVSTVVALWLRLVLLPLLGVHL